MRWFFNDGGPLIILPEAALIAWEGNSELSNGRTVVAESRAVGEVATDYDRACELLTPGLLDVGSGWGAVLPTETGWAGWLGTGDPRRFYFVGIIAADDDDPVMLTRLAEAADRDWIRVADAVEVVGSSLLLTHAASTVEGIEQYRSHEPGSSYIGEGIRVEVPAGWYRVARCTVEDNAVAAHLLRFTVR